MKELIILGATQSAPPVGAIGPSLWELWLLFLCLAVLAVGAWAVERILKNKGERP